jgi:hypothetical protein
VNNNLIIVVDRQFASGGREISAKLAERFNMPVYDKSTVRNAVIKQGLNPLIFDNAEEITNNSLIYSLSMGVYSKNKDKVFDPSSITLGHGINYVQSQIVTELAKKGPCLFVGCCADYILRQYKGCVKVFINADIDFRIKRAIKVEGLPSDIGENYIRKRDRQREGYHNCFADGSFGSPENYHLTLCSSFVGIDCSVDIIYQYVKGFLNKNSDIATNV